MQKNLELMKRKEAFYTLDLQDTKIAYAHKSNKELKEAARLFRLMNSPGLVGLGSSIGLSAIKLNLPFAESIIKKTIFRQFVGGVNLQDCQKTIDHLYKNKSMTILDYGAESKSEEADLDYVRDETINAIRFAGLNKSVPAVSTKITGLVRNEILEKLNVDALLDTAEQAELDKLAQRLNAICEEAYNQNVSIFIDAEESWIQEAMDMLVDEMMSLYNKDKITVWNTFQLYRRDKLDFLKKSHEKAQSKGYLLGAKLVRGAYMDKEAERAKELDYPNPIHDSKEDSDADFDAAVKYCVDHYLTIASCCASHNANSNLFQAKLIEQNGIDKKHPNLNFCQLYGMSDNITFNLAKAGFNVAKYLPYGPVKEVIPYLIRRAKENSSVTGDMSRELAFVVNEMSRRGM